MTDEIYIVVCTELHLAIDPFIGIGPAVVAAKESTAQAAQDCVFVPVPLQFTGHVITSETKLQAFIKEQQQDADEPAKKLCDWRGKGYL